MRKDMSKIILDTGRRGSAMARSVIGKRRRYRNRLDPDGEGGPKHIGMHSDIFAYCHRKEFSDRIGPLRRYLRRHASRPWNDVYREICAVAKLDSVTQWHLRLHLEMLVEVNTALLDGRVMLKNFWPNRPVTQSSCDLYVHPVSGRLLPNVRTSCHKYSPEAEAPSC